MGVCRGGRGGRGERRRWEGKEGPARLRPSSYL